MTARTWPRLTACPKLACTLSTTPAMRGTTCDVRSSFRRISPGNCRADLIRAAPAVSIPIDAALICASLSSTFPSSWLSTNMKGSLAVWATMLISNACGSGTTSRLNRLSLSGAKFRVCFSPVKRVMVALTLAAPLGRGLSLSNNQMRKRGSPPSSASNASSPKSPSLNSLPPCGPLLGASWCSPSA